MKMTVNWKQVDPDEVEIGSVIIVQPGEKVPIDGIIIEGNTTLNTSALTERVFPRDAKAEMRLSADALI